MKYTILIAPHDSVNNETVGEFDTEQDAKMALEATEQRLDCDYAIVRTE